MSKHIGLGLKVVGPDDLVQDGDDVISGNAVATKTAIEADRARLSYVELAAGFDNTVALTDQMVAPLIGDAATSTGAALAELFGGASAATHVETLAELQEACAAGGLVTVTSEPITLSQSVVVSAPTRVVGGNFVLPASTAGAGFIIRASGTVVDGATFTGAGIAAGWVSACRFIFVDGTAAAPLKRIEIKNCVMNGCQSENIRFSWVQDSLVFNNRISDYLHSGVLLISVDGVDVIANKIRNAPLSDGVVNPYGIAATDSANTPEARCRRVKIIGNTVDGVQWEGIDTHGGDQITIIGNHVLNCVRGIALVVGNDTRVAVPTNCIVQGNIVDRGTAAGTAREGISLFGNPVTGAKADAIITGNTIIGNFSSKIHRSDYDPAKTVVEGNTEPVGYARGTFVTETRIDPGTSLTVPIVFPAGRFAEPPNISLTVGNGRANPSALAVTASGFNLALSNWTTANANIGFPVWWEAKA